MNFTKEYLLLLGSLPILYYILKRIFKKSPESIIKSYFANKTVLITGASHGIGEGLAKRLAKYNTKLILVARTKSALQKVAEECTQIGAQDVLIGVCDITDEKQCKKVIDDTVNKFGGIDCLILCAGVSGTIRFEEMQNLEVFDKLIRTNFYGCVYLTHYSLPFLKKSKDGRIVAISSMASKAGVPFRSAYAASKSAVNGFFDVLRNELHGRVKITLCLPGFVDTNIADRHLVESKEKARPDRKKMMSVEEAVQKIVYAASSGKREERFTFQQEWLPLAKEFIPDIVDKVVRSKVQGK